MMKKEAVKHPSENSNEFKEILTRPPHSLIQYSTGIISAVLVLLIIGSFFFSTPEVINSRFTVIYTVEGNYMAQVKVSAEQVDKIKAGMEVNLEFDLYPQQDFGLLKAKTTLKKSPISESFYLMEVEIPQNSVSTRQKSLSLDAGMTGKAAIIIENIAIIERIFTPIKNILIQK